jgi:uncharacterized protein
VCNCFFYSYPLWYTICNIMVFMRYLLILLLLILSACSNGGDTSYDALVRFSSGDTTIMVEVADDNNERQKGLMYRETLNKDSGMLFIDEAFEIVDILTMSPCQEDPCALYSSALPARYALEINAGLAQELGITVGDVVTVTYE